MLKHVYRAIILVAIFIGAFYFMSKNIREVGIDINKTVELSDATFPVLYIQSENQKLNKLHGYSSNIDANLIREGITPLEEDMSFDVLIDENESKIKKIKYQVREVYKNELIDSGSISNLNKKNKNKTVKIRIKSNLEQNKEYAVQITVITNTSKKINYYTRIKHLQNPHLQEKLDFAIHFHNSIMDKKKANDIIAYLEPDITKDNSTLSYVNINSSFDLISFRNLKPIVISEIIPTINEINNDTASIEMKYVVSSDASGKTEYYNVKEFYRVRWTATRMYLLNYERKMESIYNYKLANTQMNELKIGITNDKNMNVVTNKENNKLCFVRERELWYYNLTDNSVINVFSFHANKTKMEEKLKDVRTSYDQHNIRILNMDESGNIDFMVYGYMNRGDYEGKVAIVLYKFFPAENRIQEQVYIPIDVPYQMLNQDLNQFSYVNQSSLFYFSMNNTIYCYNMLTKELEYIARNINSDQLAMSEEGKYIAWQDTTNATKAKSIFILDLETKEKKIISAPEGNNIKILGNINQNIIYGYVKTSNIKKSTDGSYLVPLHKIEIASSRGEVLKSYHKKNYFITEATVEDNIVELDRVKKVEEGGKTSYEKASSDYIINNSMNATRTLELITKLSEDALHELYIGLPSQEMSKQFNVSKTVNTIITEDTTLILKEDEKETTRYYVYAIGGIEASFQKVSDAIVFADQWFGVVINNQMQMIWERGGKQTRSEINNITPVYLNGNIDSIGACLDMILTYHNINISNEKLTNQTESAYDILNQNLNKTVLNLTGCTLDEVLYYVSNQHPVIAMKDKNEAVLIISYDEFNITVIDPAHGKIRKIGHKDATELFNKAGNVFISYIN